MIDYSRLARSTQYYEQEGFNRIEVPWTVTKACSAITAPEHATYLTIAEKNKVLVASAEQGFLYLALKGFLAPNSYQAITPCFRDDAFDLTHTKYFMKNELFIISKEDPITSLAKVINSAKTFFEQELNHKVIEVKTEIGIDLMYKKIELGSYGIRECEYVSWIYGTGCAEPRMSMALKG